MNTPDADLPRGRYWGRVGLLVAVWAVATAALTQVPTSDHPDRVASIWEAAHRAVGLFVLSAEGYPMRGPGADPAAFVLWVLYLFAPTLTAGFLVDAARRVRGAISGPERVASRARDHLVLCGFGKHGRLVVRHFLKRHPGEEAVVLDNAGALPPFVPGPWDHPVPVLREDVAADARGALTRAGIAHAAVLVAATGDDVLNVSVCLTAREIGPPSLRLVALVHDDGMTNVLRTTLVQRGVEMLDTHELAAGRLLDRLVAGGMFAEPRSLVIIGFGTFGQALCHVVLARPDARVHGLVLVDKVSERNRVVPDDPRVSFVGGAADDPEILSWALRKAEAAGGNTMVALCTDDDSANLRVAFSLRRRMPEGVILMARLFRHPPEDVSGLLASSGIQCFELEELLAERMAEVLA